jgi:type I restriction enzyme M protein
LDKKEQRRVVATQLGRRLADTSIGSDEAVDVMREAVETSPVLSQIAPGLFSENPPSKEEIIRRITQYSELSESTASHRAAMILRWRGMIAGSPARRSPRPVESGGMWRRVEIRNYRSIEHADVKLAPFTLVVGPNGSGKSNFADALVFARDIASDASTAIEKRGGISGVRRWRPSKPTDVAIDLRAAAKENELETDYVRHMFKIHSGAQGSYSFAEEKIEVTSGRRPRVELRRAGDTLQKLNVGKIPSVQETASAMVVAAQLEGFEPTSALRNVRRYRLSPDEMRQPQLSSERARLEENGANIAVAIRDVRKAGRLEDLIRAMRKIVTGLKDVDVQQVGRYLNLRFKQEQEEGLVADFNATEMSEGALRALGIVVATLQMMPDELLIIEEPEVSIHVGAAAVLFDVLKEASELGAVLVTTHSADLLDAARDEEILVCDYQNGITTIGPLATAQRRVVREGLFSVAELMRSEPLRIDVTQRRSRGKQSD